MRRCDYGRNRKREIGELMLIDFSLYTRVMRCGMDKLLRSAAALALIDTT